MGTSERRLGYEPKGQSPYLDPRWQKKRLSILDRDEFACQCCGSTSKTLHVHHLFYKKSSEGPWDYEDEALITYCDECHDALHSLSKRNANALFCSLVQAGITSDEQIRELVDFFELLRCGSRNREDRQKAVNYLLGYWEERGAFLGEGST